MELDRDAGGVTGSWTLSDSNFMTIIVASWKTTSAKWASAMMATFGSTITHDGISLHLKGHWFDWLFVSRDEMRKIVAGTGWAVRKFIEPEGDQYVSVLEKR